MTKRMYQLSYGLTTCYKICVTSNMIIGLYMKHTSRIIPFINGNPVFLSMPRPVAWTFPYLVVYSEQPRWMNSFTYVGRHVLSSPILPKGTITLQDIHPPYKLLNNDLTLTLWAADKLRNRSRSKPTWFSANITVLVWGSWGCERGISLRFHLFTQFSKQAEIFLELDTPWVL